MGIRVGRYSLTLVQKGNGISLERCFPRFPAHYA